MTVQMELVLCTEDSSTFTSLSFKEIQIHPEIRVLPSGTLSQSLGFLNLNVVFILLGINVLVL